MDPRGEAFEAVGGRYETRVLEPSPPAVDEPPWFADDPVARGEPAGGREVVSPVGTGDLRWAALAREDERLADVPRASCGTPPPSRAPSCPTPLCSGRPTSARPRSSSCAR